MAPVLQRFVALAAGNLLCLFLLRQVAFVVADDLPHVTNILAVVFAGILVGVFLQNLDDLTATGKASVMFEYLIFCLGK